MWGLPIENKDVQNLSGDGEMMSGATGGESVGIPPLVAVPRDQNYYYNGGNYFAARETTRKP